MNLGWENSLYLVRDFLFIIILIIIFVYDALYKIILSGIIWFGAIIGFIINYFFFHYSLSSLLWGVLIGGGFFLLQFLVSKGKWIGGGDVRMGVMMGIWLGFPNILAALFLAYILGALVAVILLLSKKKEMNSEIPFGTFLSLGTFISLFYGGIIIRWYVGMLK